MAPKPIAAIDPDVLRRARDGDRQAHAALYRAYAPMVFTLAWRMLGSRASAEDVLQDSFVDVIRKSGQYRGEAAIGHWIKRIAINKCLSHLRSPWASRRVESDRSSADALDANGGGEPGPEEHVGQRDVLERALSSLPATSRAVVWLHDVEGYTHREIGRLMSRSASFSKSQLQRAHEQLRAQLAPAPRSEESEPCIGLLKIV